MRFVVNTLKERQEMMDAIGIGSIDDLFKDIDEKLILRKPLQLRRSLSEQELVSELTKISRKNADANGYDCYLGAGAYGHFIPSVVSHLASRSEFYTSYTPYQAEISQGILQAIYEFQTFICQLTGMDIANASMYDGASALAEAAAMASGVSKRREVVISSALHPEYREVVRTYAEAHGLEVKEVGWEREGATSAGALANAVSENTSAVLIQSPNFFGVVEDLLEMGNIAHGRGALLVACVVEPTSLGLLKAPGEGGADIVVGEGQSLGNPISFGGPHLGFLAAKQSLLHKMPGRLVGMTKDTKDRRCFIMTLQAREQHVRREKATSNLCTNQALNALAASIYLAALGRSGFIRLSTLNAQKARYLRKGICELEGFEPLFAGPFYNEFAIKSRIDPEILNTRLEGNGIIGGLPLGKYYGGLKGGWLLCATERNTKSDMDHFVEVLRGMTR
jgi:glycine dehydrogenase subunit 1